MLLFPRPDFALQIAGAVGHVTALLKESWFLSSREGKAQFDRLNESGAKAGLNLPTVRSLLFPRPDVDEQHRIAVAIDACVQTVDQHACGLRKLQALKRGLMQDLLTGDRRVTALLEQREGVAT